MLRVLQALRCIGYTQVSSPCLIIMLPLNLITYMMPANLLFGDIAFSGLG